MRPCDAKYPSSNNWPTYSGGGSHNGLDFRCPRGSSVYAMRPGTVVDSSSNTKGWAGIYAVTVQVGKSEKDIYAHLKSSSVTTGTVVSAGQQVGLSGGQPGGTGSVEGHSTGNHLHVSTLKGSSNWVDPRPAVNWKSGGALPPPPDSGDLPGVTPGDPAGTPAPGTGQQPTQYGNFEEAAKLIKIDDLRRAAFNASMCLGTRLHRMYPSINDVPELSPGVPDRLTQLGDRTLGRGWIARDPAARVGIGENPSTVEDVQPDEDEDGVPDPLRGAQSPVIGSAQEAYGSGPNYGFRFLMNPSNHSESYSTKSGQDIAGYLQDLQATDNPPVVTATGVAVSFSLLLDRQLDFWMYDYYGPKDLSWVRDAYEYPPLSTELEDLFKYGTMYDLEYLFRTCNGVPFEDIWHGHATADIGVFAPYPVIVSLGNGKTSRRIRGSINSFTITHKMFAPGMIPIRTEVQMNVMRISDSYYMNPEDIPEEPASENPDSGDTPPGDPSKVKTDKGPKNPINFSGGLKGTSEYGHQLHSAVVAAYPWTDASGTFGTYASPGNHGNGRALDIMMNKDPRDSSNKGWDIANFVKTNAGALHVTQVIWQQKIWTTERSQEGWRAYGDHGNDTSNHWDHVHVSVGPGSGNDDFSQKLYLCSSAEYWEKHS